MCRGVPWEGSQIVRVPPTICRTAPSEANQIVRVPPTMCRFSIPDNLFPPGARCLGAPCTLRRQGGRSQSKPDAVISGPGHWGIGGWRMEGACLIGTWPQGSVRPVQACVSRGPGVKPGGRRCGERPHQDPVAKPVPAPLKNVAHSLGKGPGVPRKGEGRSESEVGEAGVRGALPPSPSNIN